MPFFCFPAKKKKSQSSKELDEKRFEAYSRLRRKYTTHNGAYFRTVAGGDSETDCLRHILLNRSVSFGDWGKTLHEVFMYHCDTIERYETCIMLHGVHNSCILAYMYSDKPELRRRPFAQNIQYKINAVRDEEVRARQLKKNKKADEIKHYQESAIAYIWAAGSLSQNKTQGVFYAKKTISKLREISPKLEMGFDYFSDGKVHLQSAIEEYDNKPISYMFDKLEHYVSTHSSRTSVLYRGMPSCYIPPVGEVYQPCRFFAASRSMNTAKRFAPDSGGTILEIVGRAAFIPNIYYNGDESEYLFSRNSSFGVTRGESGNIKLIQI
ncbi:hypothetical protein ACP6EW_02515 [Hafnia paralvei]|uniref:hypothetical protein n=1 Tax=Hafnia paralvei TaxID=546367 RepID=UPI003CF46F85